MEKAKLLLSGSGQSITEIALNCGFGSSAYFASIFRKHAHCSAREYRDASLGSKNE